VPKFALLTATNPKTDKGEAFGYWTFILHLAPAKLSGFEVCAKRTTGCSIACLNLAGHGGLMKGVSRLSFDDVSSGKLNDVQKCRIRRTRMFFTERAKFLALLVKDIRKAIKAAAKAGLIPVFRLNGTSDIRWERVSVVDAISGAAFACIMDMFPEIQFYDYTKIANRRNLPANYHLTFSLADGNDGEAVAAIRNGMNVAAVFRDKQTVARYVALGEFWIAHNGETASGIVRNGDESDLRFLDPAGSIMALYAKGNATKDASGFVRD
jgi:hypothetical protein